MSQHGVDPEHNPSRTSPHFRGVTDPDGNRKTAAGIPARTKSKTAVHRQAKADADFIRWRLGYKLQQSAAC